VKNSADFATLVKDKDAANISKALDRDVISFFIFPPLYRYFYI
jgi:hypothetical protein